MAALLFAAACHAGSTTAGGDDGSADARESGAARDGASPDGAQADGGAPDAASDSPDCAPSLAGGDVALDSAGYAITLPWYFGTLSASSASGTGGLRATAIGCPEVDSGFSPQVWLGVQSDPGSYDVTVQPSPSSGVGRELSIEDATLGTCADGGASCASQWIAGTDDTVTLCRSGCGSGTIVVTSFTGKTIAGSFSVVAEEVVYAPPNYVKTGRTRAFTGSFTFDAP